MEIEVEVNKGLWYVLLPVVVLAMVGLMLLGRAVTPESGEILTPSEWKLIKADRAYWAELDRLRRDTEELALLLNNNPDAVRVGLTADRIQQTSMDGQTALAIHRVALAEAAEAVRLWAMGGGTREEAEVALTKAVALLEGER
jgi:hypothetical protein